jgi:hypothetical protein
MPYLFVKTYEVDLMHMNKSLYHIYIESEKKAGGERRICQMRIHENGLPLTLVNNYSKEGSLHSETEARDIKTCRRRITKDKQNLLCGSVCMCADAPFNNRTYKHRKTIPQTGRVSDKKISIDWTRILKKAGYRSQFELNIARTLTENSVPFKYEEERFKYIPEPRHYTPDFYLEKSKIYVEAKGHLTKDDRVKMLLVKKQHPKLDIRFCFLESIE